MRAAMQATVKQIDINVGGDSQETFFLRVDWKTEMFDPSRCSFRMLLTDGLKAWRGKVSEAVLRAEAEELEMEKERYIQDLQEALTAADSSTQYSFTLTPPPDSHHSGKITLHYEKVQKGISLRLGSVSLRADLYPVDAVKDLLLLSVERERTLNTHNQELKEHNHRLTAEQQHITAELKRYVDGKAALETELYSRFLLVLNEKKKKIRHLQETIKQLEEARSEAAAVQSPPSAPQQKEDDEYGGSTDEEQPGPETSSTSSTSQGARSHSPLMSLSDNTDVAPSRKRRIHHVRAADPPEAKRPSAVTETGRGHSRRGSPQVVSSSSSQSAEANQQQRAPQLPDTVPLPTSTSPAPCADDLFDEF